MKRAKFLGESDILAHAEREGELGYDPRGLEALRFAIFAAIDEFLPPWKERLLEVDRMDLYDKLTEAYQELKAWPLEEFAAYHDWDHAGREQGARFLLKTAGRIRQ
jgi:hypothetical protein